jgi:serine/threonine protein kinase
MSRALGRYELLRPLARGGMAEIYLARRRAAGIEKLLVVKRLRAERAGDTRFLELFVREARLSMSLAHQNIVPVFDFGRSGDQVFLAMERVEGKDLGGSLARPGVEPPPPVVAAFIAAECCQALDYAHQRKSPEGVALGLVHRDVTPRNVLLSWSGEVKLTDFGIAALAGDATSRLLGTPQYMAPEQARSEPIDPRADIYAIGLVLREAVTGIRPRPGSDRETILAAARRGELLPWSPPATSPATSVPGPTGTGPAAGDDQAPRPGISQAELPPAGLIAIIDRATAALPGDRYPDVRSMLEDLDSFIVVQRAAHKAESPARQLAAWLASIWEGARDDVETDAAVDAEHLVSFLDDGAFDVIGTGTVRSLAATAAEDVPVAPSVPGITLGAGTPAVPTSPVAASAVPPLAAETAASSSTQSVTQSIELARQLGRISSSSSTVASGSFHTIPSSRASGRLRQPRQIAPLVRILLVGVAVGAAVFLLTTNHGERDRPSTEPASGSAPAVPPNPALPDAGLPETGRPDAGSPDAGSPDAGQAGQPDAGQPHPGQPRTGQPHTMHAGSGQPIPGTGPSGSASAAPVPEQGSNRATPAVCRVRINLTPWAYYAAEDNVRHETPSTIELTPGPHRIHVWNPELHVERDITINVPADRATMNYSEPLQPSTLSPTPGTTPGPEQGR